MAAAEKYQMDELKDLCEEQLIASTDTGNAVAHFFLPNRFKGQCRRIVFLSLLYMIILVLRAEADNCCIITEVHYINCGYPDPDPPGTAFVRSPASGSVLGI